MLGAVIREEREQSAWTEGVAIWIAVIVVSGVGKLASSSKLLRQVYSTNKAMARFCFHKVLHPSTTALPGIELVLSLQGLAMTIRRTCSFAS